MARRSGGHHNHYRDIGFSRGRITDPRLSTAQAIKIIREYGEAAIEAAKVELKKCAETIVADAKSRCPVRTGTLRDSIKAESNRDGTIYWITANASVEEPKAASGRFYYGPVVEFSPKINKPFLYPALDSHRLEIYENISEAINKVSRTV